MNKKEQPQGKCFFCNQIMTRRKLFNHLKSGRCTERQKAVEKAEQSKRSPQKLFHLRAKLQYALDFWLDLEVRGSATLKDLDKYLRGIWLECCGHMSEFSRGDFFQDKLSMESKIENVFEREKEIYHSYDFGTTSETVVELIEKREGRPLSNNPMFLMGRNEMPVAKCLECEKNATHLCIECLYEQKNGWMYCDEHTEEHPCDDYGEPVLLVNSPRLGVCGYEGPADPPY
jgi:hypothetical protein